MTNSLLAVVVGAVGLVVLSGCCHTARLPAEGSFAGYRFSTHVDSPTALKYLSKTSLPPELAAVRDRHSKEGSIPDREELAHVARNYSPDVATLLFIETVSASPSTQALRSQFEREMAFVRSVGVEHATPTFPANALVLFVPSWFYVKHGSETGSDFASQRQTLDRMHVPHRSVALDENGAVEANACTVAAAIRQAAGEGRRVIVVSASKSSPEVAQALGRELLPSETESVIGWVSIGGVVRGSPIADRVLKPDLCWLAAAKFRAEGYDLNGVKSLRTDRAGAAFRRLTLPASVKIVSLVPAPLSGDITRRGAFFYCQMKALGPNDGLALLADELMPGGSVLLDVGVDHFLKQPDLDVWTAALLRTMLAQDQSS